MYFDDFTLHHTITLAPARIDEAEMVAFAKRYDNIPLHTDAAYAATTPFGRLIAPGVMSFMAVWAKYLEQDLFAEELLAGKSTKIEWLLPVYGDDVLSAVVEVTGLTPRNEKNGIVELTFTVCNQDGKCVLTNITEAIVKRRRDR